MLFRSGEGKEYFFTTAKSNFLLRDAEDESSELKIYSYPGRKLYSIRPEENTCQEIEIRFDIEELRKQKEGFYEFSQELKYVCVENSFNTLGAFLDGTIVERPFDRDRQATACQEIAANIDGSCGRKVYDFVKKRMES